MIDSVCSILPFFVYLCVKVGTEKFCSYRPRTYDLKQPFKYHKFNTNFELSSNVSVTYLLFSITLALGTDCYLFRGYLTPENVSGNGILVTTGSLSRRWVQHSLELGLWVLILSHTFSTPLLFTFLSPRYAMSLNVVFYCCFLTIISERLVTKLKL